MLPSGKHDKTRDNFTINHLTSIDNSSKLFPNLDDFIKNFKKNQQQKIFKSNDADIIYF